MEAAVPICINNVFKCRQMSVRCTEVGEALVVVVVLYTNGELQRTGASSSFLQFLLCILRNAIKLSASTESTFVLANCNLILIMVERSRVFRYNIQASG